MQRLASRLRPLLVALTLAIALAGAAQTASAGLVRPPSGPADVPRTQNAAIYDLFGANRVENATLASVSKHLSSEGYTVKLYRDSTEGAGGHGGGTLENFVKMAKTASVIVINGHGTDFTGNSQSCTSGKGVGRIREQGPGDTVIVCTAEPQQPVLQVEWYPTAAAMHAAYEQFVTKGGFKRGWLYEPDAGFPATTLIAPRKGDLTAKGVGYGFRYWLGITTSGIKHFFAGKDVDLVDNLACHSASMATSFDAGAYFGHASTACESFESKDEPLLFGRLTGGEGLLARSAVEAFAQGGFRDKKFQLSATRNIVLSPAIESNTFHEGETISVGEANHASLGFDAKMDTANPNGVVTVSGCGATVANARWNDTGSFLTYDLAVPDAVVGGTATVTVAAKAARAASGDGDNADLDGNQDPSGGTSSGVEPNGDDYVFHVACADRVYSVQLDYQGTYRDDYTAGGFGFHETYTWHETQTFQITFRNYLDSTVPGPATLTASGTVVSSGGSADPESCTIVSNAGAHGQTVVNSAKAVLAGTPNGSYVASLQAMLPIGTAGPTPELTVSGSGDNCYYDTLNGIVPYLFNHPMGNFDPGGTLGAAWMGAIPDVDLDALAAAPHVVSFPVDYTQTDFIGGSDHVQVTATATVSQVAPRVGN